MKEAHEGEKVEEAHAFQPSSFCSVSWVERRLVSTATGLNVILQNTVAPSSLELFVPSSSLLACSTPPLL